jgi:hypothetical protein
MVLSVLSRHMQGPHGLECILTPHAGPSCWALMILSVPLRYMQDPHGLECTLAPDAGPS